MDRVLIIEDDESIREELASLLRCNGYSPILYPFTEHDFPACELALIDVGLPEKSGYELCRSLRQQSSVPVIFLTAKDGAEDELIGFAVGADDYIRKPYHSSVLLVRIARLLSRKSSEVLSAQGLTLHLTEMSVTFGEKTSALTKNETRILAFLMKKELCTRQELIEDLWNNSLYIDENTLYVNINRLREKLKELGAGALLHTVRGVGYRL